MLNLKITSRDLQILLVVLCYYLSAELGYLLSFNLNNNLLFWPPAGVGLSLMVLFGVRVWPGIMIGALIIFLKSFWIQSIDTVQLLMSVAFIVSLFAAIEAITGTMLIKKFINRTYPFTRTIYAFYFIFIALAISLVSSAASVVSMSLAGLLEKELLFNTALMFWIRNVVGILLFAPLLLAIYKLKIKALHYLKIIESVIFILSVILFISIFRVDYLQKVSPFALAFIAIPFLLWLAFRFKGVVAISGYLIVSLIAIYQTSQLLPPFYNDAFGAESILLLQVYIIVVTASSLILAAAVHERQQAQHDLKKFNENLENIVLERTQELKDEIINRKNIQSKVELTNEELQKRNTELDNFVYSVSHDLRAPIASILGLINLTKNENNNNETQLYVELMEKSALQQDYFIREILDQSRNSRLELKSEPIQFEELIEETFQQLDYSNLNGNKLEKIIKVDQKQPFNCDKWRLKVILNNIISNSIRYKNGKEPLIKINASIKGNKLIFSIADNGKGISKEHLSSLGKMFYRATDEGTGSGLGLYIVKETVQKLNGTLAIESIEGKGTTVKFEIPEVRKS